MVMSGHDAAEAAAAIDAQGDTDVTDAQLDASGETAAVANCSAVPAPLFAAVVAALALWRRRRRS
jgi:uncharacterized protein (TIGR03382 family)